MQNSLTIRDSNIASRRAFLGGAGALGVSAIMGGVTDTVFAQTSNTVKKYPPLNTMPHEDFLELVEASEGLLNRTMPAGTINEDSRYFVIVPDRSNVRKGDMAVYKGNMEVVKNKKGKKVGRQIVITDMKGNRVFPNAEAVRGKGTGARIRLNDDNSIILALGTPVKNESLPEEEQTGFPWTYVASTPPNKAFQTPAMQQEGRVFLRDAIKGVFEGKINDEGLASSILKDKTVDEAVDRRLISLLAIVEHMDIGSMEDARNNVRMDEEYAKVLTNYGLNKNLAYRYGKSGAGARGMMQITPKTYTSVSELYEDMDVGEDHTECVTDNEKSILLAAVKIDDDLGTVRNNTKMTEEGYKNWKESNSTDIAIPIIVGTLYNFGTKYIKGVGRLSEIEKYPLPEETRIYIAKIRYVWSRLHNTSLPTQVLPLPKGKRQQEAKEGRIRKPKESPKGLESRVRSMIVGKRFRLKFEKERAKKTAKRAMNFNDTKSFITQGGLVQIRVSGSYDIDPTIGNEGRATVENRALLHYLTPVAKHNLSRISQKLQSITGGKMKLTSMNRNALYVKEMRKRNPRATSPSSHEHGTTFDFRRIEKRFQKTFEEYLIDMQKKGYIIAIRESACYHIFSEKKIP